MENISLLLNNSDVGLLREFPYWQPTLAVILFFYATVPSGTILIVYLPLLVALLRMKKEHFKPLNWIHMSLLMASILEDILRICLFSIYLPSVFRYCICSSVVSVILGVVFIFFLVYRPFSFACLAALQLLVVLRKKKFANLKVSCGMITLCIGVSLVYVASILRTLYETNEKVVCYDSYCPNSRSESLFGDSIKIFSSILLVSFLPSLAIVISMSTWSCAIFKKYYTGGDDQLNRRMLSLPFIMPLALIASTVLEGILVLFVGNVISMLSSSDLFPYWIAFTNSVLLIFLRFFIRLVYPLVLVYTHIPLRNAVKRLLNRFKGRNRVTPGTVNSDTSYTSSAN